MGNDPQVQSLSALLMSLIGFLMSRRFPESLNPPDEIERETIIQGFILYAAQLCGFTSGINSDRSHAEAAHIWTTWTNASRYSTWMWIHSRIHQNSILTLEHKPVLSRYICSNSQQYTVWVKITDFYFMSKIIRILSKNHVPWRYFVL